MIDKNTTINVKAVAIIMVLSGHLIGAKKTVFNIAWLDIATFGVSLFLFISGYGLYKSFESKGLDGFFNAKIKKVYIPFALATILISGAKGFWSERWPDIVKTILFMNPRLTIDDTMWYVYYIATWYIAFYLVFRLLKNDVLRIIVLGVFSAILFQLPFSEKYPLVTFLFRFHAFSFTIGVAVAMSKPIGKTLLIVTGIAMLLAFSYLFSFHFVKYEYFNHVLTSMLSAPTIIFMLAVLNISSKLLTFIGGLSYELYLFEGAFRWNTFAPDKTASCIIFFLITLSCAYLFKTLFESIGALK